MSYQQSPSVLLGLSNFGIVFIILTVKWENHYLGICQYYSFLIVKKCTESGTYINYTQRIF